MPVEPNETYGNRLVIDLDLPGDPAPVKVQHAPLSDSSRDLMIAIDAGHGGDDPGATGRNGTREKMWCSPLHAPSLRGSIGEPGMRATLIRDGDYYVTLRDRIRARRAR